MTKPKVLAIIPARSGSKRLKNKNFKLFCGKPLFQWTIDQAIKSKLINNIIFSSDSKKILKKIKSNRNLILSLRPKFLSKDKTDIKNVIIHEIKKHNFSSFDFIILLQTTSPLRSANFIDSCIKRMISNKNKVTGVSFVKYPIKTKNIFGIKGRMLKKYNIFKNYNQNNLYIPSGDIYITKIDFYLNKKTFFSNKTETFFTKIYSDIDYLEDFKLAELEMRKNVL